jgi:hypothetical protein
MALTEHDVRTEWVLVAVLVLLLAMLLLFAGVGVLAMLTPPPVREDTQVADNFTAGVLVAGAFIATVAVVLLTTLSVLNRRDRHRITNQVTGRLLTEEMARRRAAREGGAS